MHMLEDERTRMENIVAVLVKNPANNPDQTNKLEKQIYCIKRLIEIEQKSTHQNKLTLEEATKEINEITTRLNKKINDRDQTYSQLNAYLYKMKQQK